MRAPELAGHIRALLEAGVWEAARLHLLAGVQGARTRQDGLRLGEVVRDVPRELWGEPGWTRVLAWAALRAGDAALMREVLAGGAPGLEAFRAFLACQEGRWADALRLAERGLSGPDPGVAARYRAQALVRSGQPGWREAYAGALRLTRGRDRAVTHLEYAGALGWSGEDVAARAEFAQAAAALAGDRWGEALAWSNLGITCERLGDLPGAERALGQALRVSGGDDTGQHLVAARLGLGSVYRAYGEYARARWAFQEGLRLAVNVEDRVQALIGEARTLALWGRSDEALAALYDAAGQAGVLDPDSGPHRLFAHVAAVRLLLGDERGAREALARAGETVHDARHLGEVVRAELLRRVGRAAGAVGALGSLELRPSWVGELARLFPDLFALVGVLALPPAPWVAAVNADGPITVTMHGEPLPLRAARPEAALLVMLVEHGGRLARERLQEMLDLPGRDANARRKEFSRVVGALRAALGWPGSVVTVGGMVQLSRDVRWGLTLPPPERADLFCEGRRDPWVLDWRIDNAPLMKSG